MHGLGDSSISAVYENWSWTLRTHVKSYMCWHELKMAAKERQRSRPAHWDIAYKSKAHANILCLRHKVRRHLNDTLLFSAFHASTHLKAEEGGTCVAFLFEQY